MNLRTEAPSPARRLPTRASLALLSFSIVALATWSCQWILGLDEPTGILVTEVPPEADALTGVRALRMSGLRDERSSPQRVLADAGSRPLPQVAPLPSVRVAG